MSFEESLAYLYGLGHEVSAMKLGLENTEKLLAALGNPERNYLKVQVAGTNGKGSTCAFLEAICRSAGISVGLFTSPHLISLTERIKIDGKEISRAIFAGHAAKVREKSEKLVSENELELVPTFFEQITAVAVSAFAEAQVRIAILETGLGGRLDATTATKAEIAAVTPIDFDHREILGNTLAEIAAEKAAIIRADTRVVMSGQLPEAEKVILERCANCGVMPKLANFDAKILGADRDGKFIVDFKTNAAEYQNVQLNLPGRHQIENARTAILLAETLRESGFDIAPENVIEGLQTAVHHGRLEFYRGILFDGAHNVGGAKALKNYLDEFIEQPITLIFGAMRDKDLSEIAGIIFPKAENLIFTKPENPRSIETKDLLKFLPKDFDGEKVFQAQTIDSALKLARKLSPPSNLICVTGSLYLVGEARKRLAASSGQRAAA